MIRIIAIGLATFLVAFLWACTRKTTEHKTEEMTLSFKPGPPAMIYKTRKDYSNFVTLTMNDDKTEIVSFPHPSDLYYQGKIAKPLVLKNGFLLDNQGINKNTVFTNITLEEYANMKNPPEINELIKRIIDKDPFENLCNCGNRSQFQDIENELNSIILSGLKPCKKLL